MGTEALPVLTVFTRSGCHLCDDMIAGLHRLQSAHRFDLAVVHIEGNPGLERQYGERVPVLAGAGRELCHYYLDGAAVSDFLAQFR